MELGCATGKVEGYQPRPFGCELGSHFHQRHVSRGPPIIPDSRISQVRFEVLDCRQWAFPNHPGAQALVRIHPVIIWFAPLLRP